jgi:hypothetical protein
VKAVIRAMTDAILLMAARKAISGRLTIMSRDVTATRAIKQAHHPFSRACARHAPAMRDIE